MPTPNASSVNIPTAINIPSPRQSCPPDEQLFDGIIELENASESSDAPAESIDSEVRSSSTAPTAMSEPSDVESARRKERFVEELARLRDTPSPMSALEEPSDVENRSVLSQALTADGIALYPDGIIGSPYPKTRVCATYASGVTSRLTRDFTVLTQL